LFESQLSELFVKSRIRKCGVFIQDAREIKNHANDNKDFEKEKDLSCFNLASVHKEMKEKGDLYGL